MYVRKSSTLSSIAGVLLFFSAFLPAGPARGDDEITCTSTGSDDWKQPGYIDRALEACSRVIASGKRRGTGLSLYYRTRGYWLFKKNDLDGALGEYALAIKSDPNHAENYDYRADVWVAKNQFERAVDDCTVSIRLNPNNISAYYGRGFAYQKLGRADRAKQDYQAALARPAKNRNDEWAHASARKGLAELGR
jgi:tetratricopeptide (TPR) repeat protein